MPDAIAIHGHDIIDLVSNHPDGIRLSQLMEVVAERYGNRSGGIFTVLRRKNPGSAAHSGNLIIAGRMNHLHFPVEFR